MVATSRANGRSRRGRNQVTNLQTQAVVPRDGRTLECLIGDNDADTVLIYCHGTPFPLVPYELFSSMTTERDLQFLGWSRPGYAGSTPHPGRTVRSFAHDAEEVLATIGDKKVIALGWSGGGPHALSLGAVLKDQCAAVVTIGSVAPFDVDDLNWVEGMGPENIEEFELARQGGPAFDAYIAAAMVDLAAMTPDHLVSSMAGLISAVDAASLEEENLATMLAQSAAAGGSGRPDGWIEDDAAFLAPWGFSVADISTPVSLWQGSQDLMVPRTHGEWLATYLPNVTPHLLSDEGHLSLITRHFGAMLDEAKSLGGI